MKTESQFRREFPKALRERRMALGLTQGQFAKYCGMSQDWISHFEAGRRLPSAFGYWRITQAFGDLI